MSKLMASDSSTTGASDAAMEATVEGLRRLRYGQRYIHVQEGQVDKLMCTERTRTFEASAAPPHCTAAG